MTMNKNEITITVTGTAGSGKTTIADMLQKMLEATGWVSTHVEYEKLNNFGERENSYNTRLTNIKERSKITIVEQQALRSSISQDESVESVESQDISNYFKLAEKIHSTFGYTEDWKVIPMDDCRKMHWMLFEHGVRYAETVADLLDEEAGKYYSDSIYTQRFLPKYVYDSDEFTMISCEPHVDGNKFLRIFANNKRVYKK